MSFSPSIKLKAIVCCLFLILLMTMFMLGLLNSEDAEIKAYEKFLKESELQRQNREQKARRGKAKTSFQDPEKPVDWGVQFISGKDMVNVVDGEHRQIQVHEVTIENFGGIDALVQCRDPFSKFSEIIQSGGKYEFSVTDIFHKRHYWCTVHFDKLVYNFRAYGEGAPRDNNHIILKEDGAFINGKDMTKQSDENNAHSTNNEPLKNS